MKETKTNAKIKRKLFDHHWWTHTNEYTILKTISRLQVLEKGVNNRTLLMVAARNGSLNSVRKVIELGAEINERDDMGWTALNWAVFAEGEDAADKIAFLISVGANIHSIDNNKRTILSYAKSSDTVQGNRVWDLT